MKILTILASLVLVSTALGQGRAPKKQTKPGPVSIQTATTKDGRTVLLKSDGTWEYSGDPVSIPSPSPSPADTAPVAANEGIVSIEAALVYSMGGPQPVARTEFYLLDLALPAVLREQGLHAIDRSADFRRQYPKLAGPPREDNDQNLIEDLSLSSRYTTNAEDRNFVQKAAVGILKHTILHGTTDFTGKLRFEKVPPGSYTIYGMTPTRRGYAIWNLPVDVTAGAIRSVILDQNNAAIAF